MVVEQDTELDALREREAERAALEEEVTLLRAGFNL